MKRDLKQQRATNQKSSRWYLLFFLLLVVGAGSVWFFLQPQPEQAQRVFANCVKLEGNGKLNSAEKCYTKVYQDYPQANEAAAALLSIGKIRQYDLQDEQLALLSYLQLEHDYPTSQLVLPAREEAAQIVKYMQRNYSRAIEFYQRLLDLNAGTPDQYYFEIADCYFHLENFSQARIELETLLEEYPASALADDALYRKGAIWLLEGDSDAARLDWQKLIKEFPDSSHRVAAELDLARLLEEEEFLKEALLLYQQLNESNKSLMLQNKIKHLQQRIVKKKEAI